VCCPAAFFLLAVGLKIQGLISFVAAPAVDRGDSSRFGFYVSVGSRISVILFLALMATLFMVREKAVKKADGLSPRIMAILGTFMMAVIAFFPRAELDIVQTLTATLIVLLGTCLSSIVLFRLGRSFSLMAEARKLVSTGPFRDVRQIPPCIWPKKSQSSEHLLQILLDLYPYDLRSAPWVPDPYGMKNRRKAVLAGRVSRIHGLPKARTFRLIPQDFIKQTSSYTAAVLRD
jgi:hypothetical protein